MGRSLDVVNEFYTITEQRHGAGLRALLADDMQFRGPLMATSGADEYVATVGQFLGAHTETTMLRQFEDGEQVCSIYDLRMTSPAGEPLVLHMADWITVHNGRVASQDLIYDPRAFARAFGLEQGRVS